MRANRKPIIDYINNITKINAKERLYLLTKNIDFPWNKSSAWKYEPNLDKINYSERKLSLVDIKDKSNFEYNPVDSKDYFPKFIRYMDPDKVKVFSGEVNNKMRKVQLNLAKLELNNDKFKNIEKENNKKMSKSYNKGFKIILDNKFVNKEFNNSKLSHKKDNLRETFDNFKHDFNLKLNDIENMLENNIFHKYTFMKENKKNVRKYLLATNTLFERKKTLNEKRFPKITKEKNE